jgi:glycosyltransferase involved in cell wall biosynthesis
MTESKISKIERRASKVVMVCTGARGGMRAVVEGYQADGIFERWNVELLTSHTETSLWGRLRMAASALLRFFWLLLTRQVALVHCHSAMLGSFWRKSVFAMLARAFGVPVLFHLHGSEMKTFVNRQPAMLQRLIAWILAQQTVVVVLSSSWHEYVLSISPSSRVEILPNYVNLPDLSKRVPPAESGIVKVLFLGLIGVRKGVYDLLPAFKLALLRAPGLRLTIGGNGEVDKAKAMASELGISDQVHFAGWVSGSDKVKLLAEAQLYTLPSHNEGLPVSLLEAMSWQLPVVTTRVGGIPELVRDGVDGALINAGDTKALADALADMALHASKREVMGLEARSQVERTFSANVVIPRLDGLYRAVLNVQSH